MLIDELPGGIQMTGPDVDMNRIVGSHDILMLCFATTWPKERKRAEVLPC